MKRRWNSTVSFILVIVVTVGLYACSKQDVVPASDAKSHILGVAPITEIMTDGWKTTAVVIQYDAAVDSATLAPSDYRVITDVTGQEITRVYTNTVPEKAAQGVKGPYVILELSHDYIVDIATPTETSGIRSIAPKSDGLMPHPIEKVGNISWNPSAHLATLLATNQEGGDGKDVFVYQAGEIATAAGAPYSAFADSEEAVANYWCLNRVLDDILKPDYRTDGSQGGMKYNIYFPLDYDEAETYPAVVYLAGKETSGPRHADVLTNGGIGAVVWADPSQQAKNKCIVIMPSYRGEIVDENYEATKFSFRDQKKNIYLGLLNMMDWLMVQVPNIDRDRVYLTGQGEGARAGIKMMLDRPGVFSAALLFAPDYDPVEMSKLSDANMWIVTSEADEIAAPSMDKCMAAIEANGKAVSRTVWSGQDDEAAFAASVKEMIGEGNNIKYSVFRAGTLVPEVLPDDGASNRAYTWRKGYTIEGLRDWLFSVNE